MDWESIESKMTHLIGSSLCSNNLMNYWYIPELYPFKSYLEWGATRKISLDERNEEDEMYLTKSLVW